MPPDSREPLFAEFFNERLKKQGLTLKQLSEISGISLKHLEQFAHGRFENLPPTPYLRGYFTRLGQILNFDPTDWWERVRADEGLQRAGSMDVLPKNRFGIRRNRAIAGAGILVILALSYLGFRAAKIIGKPDLEVTAPGDDTSRVAEGHIFVSGSIKNGDEIDICLTSASCEQIPLEADNTFSKVVSLEPGMNVITIVAKKFLGRETTITKQVYYDASPIQILLPESPSSTPSNTATSTATST